MPRDESTLPKLTVISGHAAAAPIDKLTARQRQVLSFIEHSVRERGYPPTIREIGQHMDIRSTNGVNDHLLALEKKGFLERQDLKSRALRVKGLGTGAAEAEPPAQALPADVVAIPLVGKVAAGQPILAVESREDTVHVDRFLVGDHRDVFALRVKGDSMIDAGILDGDLLAVHRTDDARTGQVVVARIGDEVTVKRLRRRGHAVQLLPENPDFEPIEVDGRSAEFAIEGIAVGVIRIGKGL